MAAGDHVLRGEQPVEGEAVVGDGLLLARRVSLRSQRRPDSLATELAEVGGGEEVERHVAGRHRRHPPLAEEVALRPAGRALKLDGESEQEVAAVEGVEGEALQQETLVEMEAHAAVDERQVLPGKERRERGVFPGEDLTGLCEQTLRRGEEETAPSVGGGVHRAAGVEGPDRPAAAGEVGGELIDQLPGSEPGLRPEDLPEPALVVVPIGSRRPGAESFEDPLARGVEQTVPDRADPGRRTRPAQRLGSPAHDSG